MSPDVFELTKPTEGLLCNLCIEVFSLRVHLWIELFFTAFISVSAKVTIVYNDILFGYDSCLWRSLGSCRICHKGMVVTSIVIPNDGFFMWGAWVLQIPSNPSNS